MSALVTSSGSDFPSLTALCLDSLVLHASPRALQCVVRRLPEEVAMELLHRMITAKMLTDARLAVFLTTSRRVLTLQGCFKIRNSVLRLIPTRCHELRSLDLTDCAQVNNTVVRGILQGCSSLQNLRLDGCRHITDAAFQPDATPELELSTTGCRSLQRLSFARCSQLTGELVEYLVKTCESLTDINFSRCKRIPDAAIRHLLGTSAKLQRLTLSFMEVTDGSFQNATLGQVASVHNLPHMLHAIDLTQSRITDAALVAIARECSQIEDLKLRSCIEITDVGIAAILHGCIYLRSIDLDNCGNLTDHGIAMLGQHGTHLESVNLSWCMNMTDKAMVDIARGCVRLRDLQLVWCNQLTDATVQAFAALDRPMTLHLSGCKGISLHAVSSARTLGLNIVGL